MGLGGLVRGEGWVEGMDGWMDWMDGWIEGLIDRVIGNEPFSKEVASRGLDPLELR